MAPPKKKRRPGYPRKEKVPGRITLRMRRTLYDKVSARCRRLGATQRSFIEAAIRAELARDPILERPHLQKQQDVSRTGMWIDPPLLKAMDERIEQEDSSQRAFIEDAVKAHLEATKRQKKGSTNGSVESESESESGEGGETENGKTGERAAAAAAG